MAYNAVFCRKGIEQCSEGEIWKLVINNLSSNGKRRDRLDIIAEIMRISREGALKTQIMYQANLSFAQLNGYLELLSRLRLLEKTSVDGKEVYVVTEKGLDYLQRHQEIMCLLDEDRSDGSGAKIPDHLLVRKDY